MRRTKLAATLVGIGTAASLMLPVTGAFAAPRSSRPAEVSARWGGQDSHDRRDNRNGRDNSYDRRDNGYDGRDNRYDGRDHRYDGRDNRYDRRDSRRDPRDNRYDRRDRKSGSNDTAEDIGLLVGGAVLGAIIAGHH